MKMWGETTFWCRSTLFENIVGHFQIPDSAYGNITLFLTRSLLVGLREGHLIRNMCASDLDQDSTVQISNSELSSCVLCPRNIHFHTVRNDFELSPCDNHYEGKHLMTKTEDYDVFHHFHSSDRITSDQVFGGPYSTPVTPSPFTTKKTLN